MLVLLAWSLLWFVVLSRHGGASWHYFAESGRLFADLDSASGGLHLYATRPDLQFGPASVAVAALLLDSMGGHALLAAQLLTAGAGAVILVMVRSLSLRTGPRATGGSVDRLLFVAALAFIPVWLDLAVRFVHIDDMLALACAVAALVALRQQRWVWSAVLLAVAVDAKPWALPAVALLLLVPDRRRAITAATYFAVVAVAWVPFVVTDPRTLTAVGFQIPVDPSSSLFVLGLGHGGTPGWVRLVQVLLGLVLSIIAVHRGRWAAVILVVVLSRLIVDPGVHSYYAAGVAVGAVVWDLVGTRGWPWWTTTSAAAFFGLRWIPQPVPLHGWITAVFFLAAVVLVARPRRERRPSENSRLVSLASSAPATRTYLSSGRTQGDELEQRRSA